MEAWVDELTSGDDGRAESAALRIAEMGEQALPLLHWFLESLQPDLRWWAVRALAEIQAPGVPLLLRQALVDPDLSVRQCAVLALTRQPDPAAIPQLVAYLASEDGLLARLAVDALAVLEAEAVPALLEVMHAGPDRLRLQAVRILAKIGDTRSIPTLFAALDEESAWMDYWIDEAFERMGVGMAFFKP